MTERPPTSSASAAACSGKCRHVRLIVQVRTVISGRLLDNGRTGRWNDDDVADVDDVAGENVLRHAISVIACRQRIGHIIICAMIVCCRPVLCARAHTMHCRRRRLLGVS